MLFRSEDEPDAPRQYLTSVAAGKTAKIPFDLSSGRAIRLFAVGLSLKGAPAELTSADQSVVFNPNLEQTAPVIWQETDATNTSVSIGVSGFSANARFRKIESSANADMSNAAEQIIEAAPLPNPQLLTKPSEAGAVTRYFRFSHSSNGEDYSQGSNILSVTFANSGGTGSTLPTRGGGFEGEVYPSV